MDWNKTNITYYNDTTKLEIPRFLKFLNLGVFTENADSGSGSTIYKAKVFFDLNKYSTQLYEGLYVEGMISEVKAGRPCYVRGVDSNNEGHAFICDGYKAAKRQLSIELTTTNETSVKDYSTNPYYLYKSAQGSRIMSEEYLSFNWGWGGNPTWVIRPSNSPMDLNGFNNDNKVLTIKKI